MLKDEARTDTVVLRLAIAGTLARSAAAPRDVAEMRERIALANERPEASVFHGREQAMFALVVERDPERALALARGDVARSASRSTCSSSRRRRGRAAGARRSRKRVA